MRIRYWSSDVCSSDLLALLDLAARDRILDRHLDDVANSGVAALGAAEHLDAHHFLGTGVVSHVEVALHLDHGSASLLRPRAGRSRPRASSWSSTSVRSPPPGRRRLRSTCLRRRGRGAYSTRSCPCRPT